ncbi:hypothetical protein DEO72_LG1g2615 [Vigna unguiculata]|uniref:Secreted protein n=1 Tax=Vigna unguiculata TaxID=3917 RepID=A0A4D6KMW3_VIGUN|nr:hypothetical protein DEO72_LG1g2615 [Vigna unguiculata]
MCSAARFAAVAVWTTLGMHPCGSGGAYGHRSEVREWRRLCVASQNRGFPHGEGDQRRLVVALRVVPRVHGYCWGGCRIDGVQVRRRSRRAQTRSCAERRRFDGATTVIPERGRTVMAA